MTTRDTPEAALEAALRKLGSLDPDDDARHDFGDFPGPLQRVSEHAAAILAALPPGWCEHDPDEYDRMTRVADGLGHRVEDLEAENARLTEALRQIAATPKAHRLVASICEIALAPAPSEP